MDDEKGMSHTHLNHASAITTSTSPRPNDGDGALSPVHRRPKDDTSGKNTAFPFHNQNTSITNEANASDGVDQMAAMHMRTVVDTSSASWVCQHCGSTNSFTATHTPQCSTCESAYSASTSNISTAATALAAHAAYEDAKDANHPSDEHGQHHPLCDQLVISCSETMSVASSLRSVQSSSTAPTLASLACSSRIDSLLTNGIVDQETKKQIDQKTIETLLKYKGYESSAFDTAKLYARPIAGIGTHNADIKEEQDEAKENRANVWEASRGYHHGMLVLSGPGQPESIQFVLDRVEGVRFIRIHEVEAELQEGHLRLVKQYDNLELRYAKLAPFIERQSKQPYNAAANNCLHFVFQFIDEVLGKNEWSDFKAFWQFVLEFFDAKSIRAGLYDAQQNDYVAQSQRKLETLMRKVRMDNDREARRQWVKGSTVLVRVRSSSSKSPDVWADGLIVALDEDEEYTYVAVEYLAMGQEKKLCVELDSALIRPRIHVECHFSLQSTLKSTLHRCHSGFWTR